MAKPTKHRGKWRIRWTDHAGKRQSEVYERYKDAEQALRRHQLEVDEVRGGARLPVVRGKTFNDLCDYWLATRAKEKRSQKDDRSIIECHLRPAFGRVQLASLHVSLVDRFKGDQAHLAPHTVANHLTLKKSLWDVFRRDPTPQKGIFTALPAQAIAETLCWYILTGVLERHPKLRVVFVEPGLYWVAGFIRFLDSRMGAHYEFPGVKELPSTYFKRQMAVTFVHEPEGVEMRHALGIENVLWSTDFPHPVCNWPNAGEKIVKQFAGVPEDEVHAITWANGARMYGIE